MRMAIGKQWPRALLIAGFALVLALPATARVLYHPDYPARKDSIKTIMLLEPEVSVTTMHKTTQHEIDLPKQTRIKQQIVDELNEILEDKGFRVIYWTLDDKSQQERELYADVVAKAKEIHAKIGSKAVAIFSNKAVKVEESLGEKAAELAALTGADAIAVFRYSIETLSQAAENKEFAKTILLAAAGIQRVTVKSNSFFQMSFFDGTTTELLWYNHGLWQEMAQFGGGEADLTSRYWVLFNIENTIGLFPDVDVPSKKKSGQSKVQGGQK